MSETYTPSMEGRQEWIDLLKGFAIWCVVVGHMPFSHETVYLKNIIYSFHMPLFFLLAGCTAGISIKRSQSIYTFIRKRIVSVLLPYIAWSFLYGTLFTSSISELTSYNLQEHLRTLLLGGVHNWFLICLFILQLYLALYALITRHASSCVLKLITGAVIFCLAVVAHKSLGQSSETAANPISYFTTAYVYFIPFSIGVALFFNRSIFNFFTLNKWLITACLCVFIFAAGLWNSIPFGSNYPKIIIGLCVSCILIRLTNNKQFTPPRFL